MKNIYIIILLAILVAGPTAAQQKDVTATTFEQHISLPNAQLLDVRTPGEFKEGHIKNALQADWTSQEQFKERVKYLDKNKPVLVYCASGGRSGQAAEWLYNNGFKQVENLKGGFIQWKQENKPFEQIANTPQLSSDAYKKYTASSTTVLIEFGAEWCPPCKIMAPVVASVQRELKDQFKLVHLDGGINTDVMKQQNVAALPTFIVYKNGKEVWRKQGVTEKSELIKQLSR